MSLLNGTLAIRDVRDVEAFARQVLQIRLGQWGARLEPDDWEDALAYLVALAWELDRGFNEKLGIAYSTYLFRMLRLRLADWYRERFGDSRYGSTPAELIDPRDPQLELLADTEDWVSEVIERVHSDGWVAEVIDALAA